LEESNPKVRERLVELKEKVPEDLKSEVDKVEDEGISAEQAEPEPPPPEAEEPGPEEPMLEEVMFEEYEEELAPEEPVRKKRRRRGYGKFVALAIILIILLAWTVLSPDVMPQVGTIYTDSEFYASLGSFVGSRDIWAGNMTWGVAIRGPDHAEVGEEIDIYVLVTKVYEDPGNPFFKGTWFTLENVSIFLDDGTEQGAYLASMANYSSLDYGMDARVPLVFDSPGVYDLLVYAKITVYMNMWIGFLPLESVNIRNVFLDEAIVVSAGN
jgi:hypothetical protein